MRLFMSKSGCKVVTIYGLFDVVYMPPIRMSAYVVVSEVGCRFDHFICKYREVDI